MNENLEKRKLVEKFAKLSKEEFSIYPDFLKIMNTCIGAKKAIKNRKIVKLLQPFTKNKVDDAMVRKFVFYARNTGDLKLLIANTKGHFLANDITHVEEWLFTHIGKIEAMKLTKKSIKAQYDFEIKMIKRGKRGSRQRKPKLRGQLRLFDLEF